jgi:hypothetical protein
MHQVLTGPVGGTVRLADGTTYDITPYAIEVASEAHAGELVHHIERMHEANGGLPVGDTRVPFAHACTDRCGVASPAQAAPATPDLTA